MIRSMRPEIAVERLKFVNRGAAGDLAKAIKTALANAGKTEGLAFKKIEVNEGMKMKRYRVGTAGRGRGRPYKKRLSHIKIVLTDEVELKAESANRKVTAKNLKVKNESNGMKVEERKGEN